MKTFMTKSKFIITSVLLSFVLQQIAYATSEYEIVLDKGSKYAAPTNMATLYRTDSTPKNIWVTLTTSLTKLEKIKSDGNVERTYRSDYCPEEYQTELAEEGKLAGEEIIPQSKVICRTVVEGGPCQKKTIHIFTIRCKDSDCSQGNRKRSVCYKNVEEKVRVKFKNMPKLEANQKERFTISSYSNPNKKKVHFALGAKYIHQYKVKHRNRNFIIVKYVGPNGKKDKSDGKDEENDLAEKSTEQLEQQKQNEQELAEQNKPGKCESCGPTCLSIDTEKFIASEKMPIAAAQ